MTSGNGLPTPMEEKNEWLMPHRAWLEALRDVMSMTTIKKRMESPERRGPN